MKLLPKGCLRWLCGRVVLLWGEKTSDAPVAQINKVENKMAPGRDAAPGIVAYLMPPQQASEPIPAWGWQVLRFDARDEDTIDVVAEERVELSRFLRKVLRCCQLREAAAGVRSPKSTSCGRCTPRCRATKCHWTRA